MGEMGTRTLMRFRVELQVKEVDFDTLKDDDLDQMCEDIHAMDLEARMTYLIEQVLQEKASTAILKVEVTS